MASYRERYKAPRPFIPSMCNELEIPYVGYTLSQDLCLKELLVLLISGKVTSFTKILPLAHGLSHNIFIKTEILRFRECR